MFFANPKASSAIVWPCSAAMMLKSMALVYDCAWSLIDLKAMDLHCHIATVNDIRLEEKDML